jgi:hypothetical protein
LISVLLAALIKFQEWLTDRGPFLGPRTWRTLWLRRTKTTKSELRTEVERLMANTIEDLRGQLYLTDEAPVLTTRKSGLEATESAKAKAAAKGKFQTLESSLEAEIASQKKSSLDQETQEEFRRSKIDLLHRSILDYHRLFDSLSDLAGRDCFLFLDDLYHIVRKDQPQILDYFHRIAKGHSLWLKVGTIKHRSTWYVHSPQPIGLKTGDDADERISR